MKVKVKTSAIVPAHNEEPRIGTVLDTLVSSDLFDLVVVVDDGSTDDTWNEILARPVAGIRHPTNLGKAAALQSGLHRVPDSDAVAFIDADLLGLKTEHLESLLEPITENPTHLMTVAQFHRARAPVDAVQKWFSILNGQRVLSRRFLNLLPDITPLRFGIEVFMTRYARDLGPGHIQVPWRGVSHVMKEEKYGLLPGFARRLIMYKEVMAAYLGYYPRWAKRNLGRIDTPLDVFEPPARKAASD